MNKTMMNYLHKIFFLAAGTIGGIYLFHPLTSKLNNFAIEASPEPQTIKSPNIFPIVNYDSPNLDLKQPEQLLAIIKDIAPEISTDVLNKVAMSLSCHQQKQELLPNIVSIIDYSLPSYQKRLWVIDLQNHQRLYHTYVSHGLRSGEAASIYFSNANNSRASSEGVYATKESYRGREGSSLRLKGLDRGINDMAEARAIVMHGGFYVEEDFIKKYGRAGRSWGCPALPSSQTTDIINSIKDNNLLLVYYPSDKWFLKSAYLNCKNYSLIPQNTVHIHHLSAPPPSIESLRGEVLFANISGKRFGGETTPILAINAHDYQNIFNKTPPLLRMLRRQIAHQEYIAIDKQEFEFMAAQDQLNVIDKLVFVVPQLTNNHGYIQTVMKPVYLGKISKLDDQGTLAILTSEGRITLSPNNQFIRWLGL